MILYHFTSKRFINKIKLDGLTKGVMPVKFKDGVKLIRGFQWLTLNPSSTQLWNTRKLVTYSRTDYRLTVEIPDEYISGKLLKWKELNELMKINPDLDTHGDPENWYVYKGKILRSWIIRYDRIGIR